MPRYIRANTPGATYFFTVTLQNRQSQWLTEHIGVLRNCLAATKAKHPFRIDAMVILPEHLHTVWTLPQGDSNFPLRWMLIKRGFTRQLLCNGLLDASSSRRRGDDERGLWGRRYWEHQIRDEDDFARHVDYIHFNPVKHGLVTRAADWPHSSFQRYVRDGVLREDWGLTAGMEGQYGE